jgi:uncharacterized membrane protein
VLAPQASAFLTQTATIQEDTTNLAAWMAYNPGPSDQALASDSATVNVIAYGVELLPEIDSQTGDPGETVEYFLTLTNTGNVTDTINITAGASDWAVQIPTTSFVLGPDESTMVAVQVAVPAGVLAGASDQVTITAISQTDASASDSSTLTTTANPVYGVTIEPETAAMAGPPGSMVEYELTLTNTGNITDTFDISAGTSEWDVQIPTSTLTLGPGESAAFPVQVSVPETAEFGETDQVTVTAVSQGDSTITASAILTTTAGTYGLTLEPASATASGGPGETVIYNLTLTNTGSLTDTIELTTGTTSWAVDLPVTTFELGPGESAQVTVEVTIPSDATGGESEPVTVTATSSSDPSETDSAVLTTTVDEFRVYLPLILMEATP